MYQFIDVTNIQEGISMPSEALKINGKYIEDQIKGYRTLTVSGREALSPEVATYETGIRDGSILKGKRYPARILKITYQIKAESSEEFREAYNKLASILNVEDAELIFNDEQDKYFIGTPAAIGEVTPGRNCVVGDFEILCLDPFKYSVKEYVARVTEGQTNVVFDYNGTYKSFPRLCAEFYREDEISDDGTAKQLTGAGDCGYVAFFNENEKIIQLGDPEEVGADEGVYKKSQTLVNTSFDQYAKWSDINKNNWKLNSGIGMPSFTQSGNVEIGVAEENVIEYEKPQEFSGHIKTCLADLGKPKIYYEVYGTVTKRSKTKGEVIIKVISRFAAVSNYMKTGYLIRAEITVGGVTKNIVLKDAKNEWYGINKYTTTATFKDIPISENKTSVDVLFKTFRRDNLTEGTAGVYPKLNGNAVKIGAIPFQKYVPASIIDYTYSLLASNYGSASGNVWVGPSITRKIPADANGDVGATNFTFTFGPRIKPSQNETVERGAFQALLVSGSGESRKVIAGMQILGKLNSKKSTLNFIVNGKQVKTMDVDISHKTGKFINAKQCSIIKSGKAIKFSFNNKDYTFTDAEIATESVTEITFHFAQLGNLLPYAIMGLQTVKFVKNNCQTWRDIPNKFSANDIVEADCKEGEIYLNGLASPALGALGNDWEDFYLKPGINQIGVAYSEWVTADYAPNFTVKYREVFL